MCEVIRYGSYDCDPDAAGSSRSFDQPAATGPHPRLYLAADRRKLNLRRSTFRPSDQSRPVRSNMTRTIRMTPITPTPP